MKHSLKNQRILVVEDEYFIANDLKRALAGEGAEVVGPVGDLAGALRLARSEALDAALLDINLDGAMSYEIVDALTEAGVPHLFLTGYDEWSLPERYRATPRLAKPFSIAGVVDTMATLCNSEAAR